MLDRAVLEPDLMRRAALPERRQRAVEGSGRAALEAGRRLVTRGLLPALPLLVKRERRQRVVRADLADLAAPRKGLVRRAVLAGQGLPVLTVELRMAMRDPNLD